MLANKSELKKSWIYRAKNKKIMVYKIKKHCYSIEINLCKILNLTFLKSFIFVEIKNKYEIVSTNYYRWSITKDSNKQVRQC